MATYLITGTSRGIGLELVKQLLDLPNTRVSKIFAVTRNAQSTALQKLIDVSGNRIQNVTVDDITDETNVQKALSNVEKALQGQGLDVLINNAGVQPFSPKLCDVPAQQLVDVFNVNVVSAHIFTAAALPLLRKGRERRIINMSTVMGSIAYAPHFKVAPTHAYKISKAAMNMLNAQYALEYGDEGFTFLAISPGWLRSDMGSEHADLGVSVGVNAVKEIILKAGKDMNGKFVNIHVSGWENANGPNQYDGKEIPW